MGCSHPSHGTHIVQNRNAPNDTRNDVEGQVQRRVIKMQKNEHVRNPFNEST